ncbi:hypothetical protein Droror1_Dr00014720 [Drosera rotundifolia]
MKANAWHHHADAISSLVVLIGVGKTVSLDPRTNVVVPEDRHGLFAIDVLDPDLILGKKLLCYFHNMIVEMIKWGFEEGKHFLVLVMIFGKLIGIFLSLSCTKHKNIDS